jgi:hypothetical protein
LTDEIDKEPTPPTADAETEPLTLAALMLAPCTPTVAVTAPVLVPARVVVVVTTRDSLGAVLTPDVAKLIESEPDAPTAEPEIEPPVPVVIDGEVIPPVMAIVPLLVALLLTDATVHVPFGAVCAMADDAEISADVISSAKREVLFKVIFSLFVEIIA